MTGQQALSHYAARQDADAFGVLVEQYQRMVYSAASRRLARHQDVEDVVQTTFLKLAKNAGAIRRDLAAWLYTTAVNTANDLVRRDQTRRRHEALAAPSESFTLDDEKEEWRELSLMIDEVLLELPAPQRSLIVEHFLRSRSQRDLAEELRVSQPTVNRRIEAAINELRKRLGSRGYSAAAPVLMSSLARIPQPPVPAGLTAELVKVGLSGVSGSSGAAASWLAGALWLKIGLCAISLCVLSIAALVVGAIVLTPPTTPPASAAAPAASQPLAFAPPAAPDVPTSKPSLTKDDILATLTTARSHVHDLDVSFSFNALHSEPDDPMKRFHAHVVVKGNMLYIEKQYSGAVLRNGRAFDRELAFNGQFSTLFIKPGTVAFRTAGKSGECRLNGLAFFQIGFLCPAEIYSDAEASSLPSLLKSSRSRLRPVLEVIEGKPCYVIDLFTQPPLLDSLKGTAQTGIWETVWLDPAQGFLPIQVLIFGGTGLDSRPMMETTIDQAKEVLPGFWVPLHGRKVLNTTFSDHNGVLDAAYQEGAAEYTLEVDGCNTDHPAIIVNSGVADDFFELWKRLPAGTRVLQ